MITNKIVTRGMGLVRGGVPGRAGLVVQGYGGLPSFVVAALQSTLKLGQSGYKRRMAELEEVIIWAKLIEVNDRPPPREVKGWIRVRVKKDQGYASVLAEHVSSRIRAAWESIKVTVTRVK
jgi:hypothetical protein